MASRNALCGTAAVPRVISLKGCYPTLKVPQEMTMSLTAVVMLSHCAGAVQREHGQGNPYSGHSRDGESETQSREH